MLQFAEFSATYDNSKDERSRIISFPLTEVSSEYIFLIAFPKTK